MPEQYFQHRFERVEDYLHHRSPYLMVDRVLAIEDRLATTETTINEEDFFIQGHFPGAPVVPGAMLQEMTTQSAGILLAANRNPMQTYNTHDPQFNEFALGVLVSVVNGRFRGFARSGDHLVATVELRDEVDQLFDFSGTVRCNDRVILKNRFRLANIPSETLIGTEAQTVTSD
ncbi:MAG: 3-hydroxyacyl-ACP dehydratase FabZ family protein [Fuerstiella sp.]